MEPSDGGAGVEVAAAGEARRDEPAPHARLGVRRAVHGDGATVSVQQCQQPVGSRKGQRPAAAAAIAGAGAVAGEGDVLDAATGEGARVVVAAVEAGDGGDVKLAEEVCVVFRAEYAAAAVDVGPRRTGEEAGVGGRGAEDEQAVGDNCEDLAVDGAAWRGRVRREAVRGGIMEKLGNIGLGAAECSVEAMAGSRPGVVEVFIDVELVLFELAVNGPLEVDPAHSVGLVEGTPEVFERQVDVMRDAEVGVHRTELDACFIAIATSANHVTANEERCLQLHCPGMSSTYDDVCSIIFLDY